MNNEPIAWIIQSKYGLPALVWNGKPIKYATVVKQPDIPLYTTPQIKELSDEEIKTVYGEYFDSKNCDWIHLECIRAILKKASEK